MRASPALTTALLVFPGLGRHDGSLTVSRSLGLARCPVSRGTVPAAPVVVFSLLPIAFPSPTAIARLHSHGCHNPLHRERFLSQCLLV